MTSGSELGSSIFNLRGVLDVKTSGISSMCFRLPTRLSDTTTGRSDDGSVLTTVLIRALSLGGSCGSSILASGTSLSSPWVEFVLCSVSSARLRSGGFDVARREERSVRATISNPENEALPEVCGGTLEPKVAFVVDADNPSAEVTSALELSNPG
jgi:hypothetical protein